MLHQPERNDHGYGCVDPEPQEEKEMLDVPDDGFCNVCVDPDP